MNHDETEAQRRAMRALSEFRNSVIDWCVGVIQGHNEVARTLTEEQYTTIVELLQNEKDSTV